jgi:hypothetical protein
MTSAQAVLPAEQQATATPVQPPLLLRAAAAVQWHLAAQDPHSSSRSSSSRLLLLLLLLLLAVVRAQQRQVKARSAAGLLPMKLHLTLKQNSMGSLNSSTPRDAGVLRLATAAAAGG